jgi:hypothetical protein
VQLDRGVATGLGGGDDDAVAVALAAEAAVELVDQVGQGRRDLGAVVALELDADQLSSSRNSASLWAWSSR